MLGSLVTLTGKVFEPRVGPWWAEVEVDADDIPTGLVTLDFFGGGAQFIGTVSSARSVADSGRVSVRIDGGTGLLDQRLPAKHFRNVTLLGLLDDVCRITGDTLDVAGSELDTFVRHWTRPATLADAFLGSVAAHTGASWRVQRNGTIRLAQETWPVITGEFVEAAKMGGGVAIYPEGAPFVTPGSTFLGQRVAEVITEWGKAPLTQAVAYEDDQTTPTEHTRSIQQDVVDWFDRTRGTKLSLSGLYPCRVVGQSADLSTVDLIPDDTAIRGQGLNGVPVRYGLPGIRCRIKTGARVRLGWDSADPSRPFAAVFDREGVDEVVIEPDASGNVVVGTTGGGTVTIRSESRVVIQSPDVRIGSDSGTEAACKGDRVLGKTEPMFYLTPAGVPAPVINGLGSPLITVASQIVTGRAGVRAG